MPTRTLIILAELSLEFGLIDVSEFEERRRVAIWMDDHASRPDSGDPREPGALEAGAVSESDEEVKVIPGSGVLGQPDWVELLVLGKWLFTKSDPDAYPSTPHGHLQSATREWPKLNPYTGRVFKQKHQEDTTRRLSNAEMQRLWRSHAFRDFCRSYIVAYVEENAHYNFAVKHPLRFPRW